MKKEQIEGLKTPKGIIMSDVKFDFAMSDSSKEWLADSLYGGLWKMESRLCRMAYCEQVLRVMAQMINVVGIDENLRFGTGCMAARFENHVLYHQKLDKIERMEGRPPSE